MRYRLKSTDGITELEAAKSGAENDVRFNLDGKAYHVQYRAVSESQYHLVVDGKGISAFVARRNEGKQVFVSGRTFLIQDEEHTPARRVRRSGGLDAPGEVTPPMPSVVVRIMVQEGDRVKQGQGLLVLSAMKMETTLKAPRDGVVKKINTALEAKVSPGDILVEFEKEET
jgi:biotin carboxyl carrier protein